MELYHVGYVVADIEKAMAHYGAALGLTWAEITPRPLQVRLDGGDVQSVTLLATYSQQGPPYIELIQEIEGDVWVSRGLDHLGYWVDDLAAGVAALSADHNSRCVQAVDESGQATRFSYCKDDLGPGPWIELVDSTVRPALMDWICGHQYVV